eukprot:TCONS_00058646-protein
MDDFVCENGLKPEVASVLNNVFLACDDQKTGLVHVSRFITFLKEKATGTEILNFLDDLTPLLDDEGLDPMIDWSTCEDGLKCWIKYVNERTNNTTNTGNSAPNSPIKQLLDKSAMLDSPYPINPQRKHNDSSFPSTYSNDSFETSELSWDHSDFQVRLEELEIKNKKLAEDNSKLQRELINTEDQNSIILNENDKLKSTIAKHEKLLEENRKVCKSYEELKLTVVEYQNLKNDLIDKTCLLERENNSLQQVLLDYDTKFSRLDASLEAIKEEKVQLTHEVSLQKNLLNQIEDLKTSKECVVEESENKAEYMSALIAELSLANEVLKAQKGSIENELSEVKQDVCRISMLNNIQSTPLLSSTRCEPWVPSIRREPWGPSLQEELIAEMDSEGETFEDNSSVCTHLDFSDASDYSPSMSRKDPTSPKQFSHFAQQCRDKFKEKKQIVFTKIEDIVKHQETSIDGSRASLIVEDLNRDLESFTEKIAEFAQGKQTAEKKAHKLAIALKKIREEKEVLADSRDKALQKIGDLSLNSQDVQQRLSSALREIEQQKVTIDNLQTKILEFSVKAMLVDGSSQCNLENPNENKAQLAGQIDELKRLVDDLESRNMDFSRKVFDLEEELSFKNQQLMNANNNMDDIQASLKMVQTTQSKEIMSLLNIIPQNHDHTDYNQQSTWQAVHQKLEEFISHSVQENKKLLGVRESPDGGTHYSDTSDEISSLKQQYLSEITVNNTSSVNEHPKREENREIGIQTDLDMVGMNKLYDNFDEIFTPVTETLPERLKYNSIDMTNIVSQSEKGTLDVVEDQIISPVNEEMVSETNPVVLDEEVPSPRPNDVIIEDSELSTDDDGSSSKLDETLNDEHLEQSLKVTVEEITDENNNEPQISSSVENLSPPVAENSPVDGKKSPVNLFIANIIEYGRSDVSSDSDNDGNRKDSFSRTRRKRIMQRRSRTSEDNESETKDDCKKSDSGDSKVSNETTPRRRRHGVSAEPVRVSWSTLRESFKKLQLTSTLKDIEQEQQSSADELQKDSANIDTSDIAATEVSEEQLDSLIQNIPSIEVSHNDAEKTDNIETKTDEKTPPTPMTFKMPPNSPSPVLDASQLGSLDFSIQNYIEDQDLEKKFNNLVFAFKTDIYTLQKRLETQERARDVAEASMEKEIMKLSKAIGDVQKNGRETHEYAQTYSLLSHQSDILRKAAMKVSAQSEQHGSYQQENRMCQNFEMIIQYTDALRFNMTKMKNEIEEFKTRYECTGDDAISTSRDQYSSEYCSVQEDKDTDNEFPKTETITTLASDADAKENKPSSPRPTFCSISKSLVMAKGMAKLRKQMSKVDEKVEKEPEETTFTSHSRRLSPAKRVQFGETSFSIDKEDHVNDSDECSTTFQRLCESTITKNLAKTLRKFLPLILTLFIIYALANLFVRSLEVDTLKLHDQLLRFIPHTIEPAQPKVSQSQR